MKRTGAPRFRFGAAVPIGLAGWLLAAPPADAQLAAGFSVASFQLNLSNPGARSLGMGGAFAGLADDATAAYANPAGLTVLARPEVSFEGRSARFRLPLVAAEPIVNGVVFTEFSPGGEPISATVSLEGLAEATPLGAPDASGTTASFASLVYPVGGWTLALYHHQLVDLEAGDGVALPEVTTSVLTISTTLSGSTRTRARVDLASVGVAAARRVGKRLSLGLTLVHNRASIEARRTSDFVERTVREPFPPVVRPLRFDNLVRGDDTDLTLNAGLLVRPTDRWSFGLAFRQGPAFDLEALDTTTISRTERVVALPTEDFRVPDVFALGGSVRATRRLVVAFEWDRIRYSQLASLASVPASLARRSGPALELARLGRFEVDDADELRAGLEFSFWRTRFTPAIRLGVWREPEHKVRFEPSADCPVRPAVAGASFRCSVAETNEGDPFPLGRFTELFGLVSDATAAAALERLFPPGDDEIHWTGGFGIVVGSRFQVDAAFDYVDGDRYTLSISGLVQF